MIGRLRAADVARRLGIALREARLRVGKSQAEIGRLAGVSQTLISKMERGLGSSASLETWASVAAAVDEQLAAFFERTPGAAQVRDYQHLRLQQLVVEVARLGGWMIRPEDPIDPHLPASRSVDVTLVRAPTLEAVVVECTNHVDDLGATWRNLDRKVDALGRHLAAGRDVASPPWSVRGVWVVRGSRRNRDLFAEFAPLVSARFRRPARAWLAALSSRSAPLPPGMGLVLTDAQAGRLIANGPARGNGAPRPRPMPAGGPPRPPDA
jgi:transcriptional regulator with XRE-family HTH domain